MGTRRLGAGPPWRSFFLLLGRKEDGLDAEGGTLTFPPHPWHQRESATGACEGPPGIPWSNQRPLQRNEDPGWRQCPQRRRHPAT